VAIRVGSVSCEVIGLLKAKGQTIFGTDQDDLLVMPWRTLHRRIAGNRDITMIYAAADSREATGRVQQDIERLMRQRRRIVSGAEDDFEVQNLAEITRVIQNTTRLLTTFLGAMAAIRLLVGALAL
jgi:putative ABC transport system permease protein